MLAVDGSKVSEAIAGAAVMAVVFVLILVGLAVFCAVAAVRSLREGRAGGAGVRSGAVAGLVLAGLMTLGAGQMTWSWVRYGLDQWDAQRTGQARAGAVQRCQQRWLGFGSSIEGYPPDAVTSGGPPENDRNANSVWRDNWVAGCVAADAQ